MGTGAEACTVHANEVLSCFSTTRRLRRTDGCLVGRSPSGRQALHAIAKRSESCREIGNLMMSTSFEAKLAGQGP